MTLKTKELSLREIVGGGYDEFWTTKKRYVVCKGSRASKKSKTTALWHIVNIMAYPGANALVIRKTERTLRDSCFADLKWAINRLGVNKYWKITVNPLELIYKKTGQKILFRGLDSPLKLTSIAVDNGVICFLWLEEAFEITKEEDFNYIDECIRGKLPEGLWKRVTILLNPWSERHWIKKRFFDNPDEDTYAFTTTYKDNEFLDEADLKLFERMKKNNPRRYNIAGLGNWGISEGLVFENFMENNFDLDKIKKDPNAKVIFGLDFGYVQDPTAFFCGIINIKEKRIYVFDEIYKKGLSNEKIYLEIAKKGYSKEKIIADCAEPKSIDRLYDLGLSHISPSRKGPDSILNGIDFLTDFQIIIKPQCVNFYTEIQNYTWQKDKFDRQINKPIDEYNHLIDAMRYAVEPFIKARAFSFD